MKPVLMRTTGAAVALSLLWPSMYTAAASLPAATPPAKTVPAPVKLLKDDPRLQGPVTLDVVEEPLGNVLSSLNPTLKLDLSAERMIADQRVTLHVVAEPLYVVMGELVALLSHDPAHPHGYHWGPLDLPAGSRTDYQLWRDTNSVAEEQAILDAPRRRLVGMLRDMWTGAQDIAPADNDLYGEALRSLTSDQIDALADGEAIPLNPSLFTDQENRFRPTLQVVPADQDSDMEFPDRAGQFDLTLFGPDGGSLTFDTNSTPADPDPKPMPLPPDTGPRVDLAPYLTGPGVTPQQQEDLGFTLQALGKAAHLNIYQEGFLRTSADRCSLLSHPNTLQGSVPRLVAQICTLWNYRAVPIPGGYLFWSRTWAQDRARDVPERLITPWRKRLAENGTFSLYDRAEIDADLTWPQVSLTLDQTLPEAADQDSYGTYRLLNLFGSLTTDEQAQALSPDGLPVSALSAHAQETIMVLAAFHDRPEDATGDQFAQAILKFHTEDVPEYNVERLVINVDDNGHSLMETRCTIPLKPDKTGGPSYLSPAP